MIVTLVALGGAIVTVPSLVVALALAKAGRAN
jgi:hypothetical protein